MKTTSIFRGLGVAAGLLAPAWAAAQDGTTDLDRFIAENRQKETDRVPANPHYDPHRIINESSNFLKEREPEMTDEEYALYEKSVTLLAGNPAFAIKLLETMSAGKTASPAFDFILGNAYYASGNMGKARSHYLTAIAGYPTFLRAWNDLGVLAFGSGDYAEAVRCLSQCVTLGDHDPKTFGLLGFSQERAGNFVSAEVAYLQALAGDPSNMDWTEGLLRIYVRGRQYGRAEGLVKDLVRHEPKRPELWMTYADILIGDGRKIEATAVLEAADGAGYLSSDERRLLGDLYAEQRMIPEAIATYRRLRDGGSPLGEERLLTFARLLTFEHACDEAAEALNTAIAGAKPGERGECFRAQAELYAAQKNWTQARSAWSNLLQLEPMNPTALLGAGRADVALGDETRAEMNFEEAATLPAGAYEAQVELATLAIKRLRYAEALPHLERALALKDGGELRDLVARLRPLAQPVNIAPGT